MGHGWPKRRAPSCPSMAEDPPHGTMGCRLRNSRLADWVNNNRPPGALPAGTAYAPGNGHPAAARR